jgi:hypothetical protein
MSSKSIPFDSYFKDVSKNIFFVLYQKKNILCHITYIFFVRWISYWYHAHSCSYVHFISVSASTYIPQKQNPWYRFFSPSWFLSLPHCQNWLIRSWQNKRTTIQLKYWDTIMPRPKLMLLIYKRMSIATWSKHICTRRYNYKATFLKL